MRNVLFPTRRACAATSVLLGSVLALAAVPAQATDTQQDDSPWVESSLTTANAPVTLYFNSGDPAAPNLPAGTYWIEHTAVSDYEYPGVAELYDKYANATRTWHRIVLTEPDIVTFTIDNAGEPGRLHGVSGFAMEADAPDPATLTEDELVAYLEDDAVQLLGGPYSIQAALVDAHLPFPQVQPDKQTDFWMLGDFEGIGVNVQGFRQGNIFHLPTTGDPISFSFGRPSDEVLVGDWDGDGRESIMVRRGNAFYADNTFTGGGADLAFTFGRATDEVLVGDWDSDGKDSVAVRRGATFHVLNTVRSGAADLNFHYGRATDDAYAYDWDQDGTDTFAVLRGTCENAQLYVRNSIGAGVADGVYDATC